jgi:hypothetical protein
MWAQQGDHAFGGGRHIHNGVLAPWLGAGGVGVATPEIHNGCALYIDTDRRAYVTTRGEIVCEGLAHCHKTWITLAVDLRCGRHETPP